MALGAALTVVLGILWRPLTLLGALLTGFVASFFRNPVRQTPRRSGVVFAPADRRIVCQVAAGSSVTAGRTFGLIRFGSRVDTYLPLESRVLVERGQRTTGGVTVLAELGALARETELERQKWR